MIDKTPIEIVAARLNTSPEEVQFHWNRFNSEPTGALARNVLVERINQAEAEEMGKLRKAGVADFQKLQGRSEGLLLAIAIINEQNLTLNQPEQIKTI